jgi:nitroreductase
MRYLSLILISLVGLTVNSCAHVEGLPAPVVHGSSFEVLSNSRYSVHSGFSGELPRQVMANVLWAMARVPKLGSYREFYVATPAGVYRYDEQRHALALQRAGDHRAIPGSAFEIGIAGESDIEVGGATQAGLLAGTAFRDSAGGSVVSCPMARPAGVADTSWRTQHPLKIVCVYGAMAADGLKREILARPSDSSLSVPRVDGPDTFEVLLKRLREDSVFESADLPLPAISQILWAGYGVTPHSVSRGKQGLTVPSAVARYFLTGEIYLVSEKGVMRYHNRLPPGTDAATSDHRLEAVGTEDRRAQLRVACPDLSVSAPVYIVVCVTDTSAQWAAQEAGYVGFQYLMQAQQLGLGGCLRSKFSPAGQKAIGGALGLPDTDLPVMIFSTGRPRTR